MVSLDGATRICSWLLSQLAGFPGVCDQIMYFLTINFLAIIDYEFLLLVLLLDKLASLTVVVNVLICNLLFENLMDGVKEVADLELLLFLLE